MPGRHGRDPGERPGLPFQHGTVLWKYMTQKTFRSS